MESFEIGVTVVNLQKNVLHRRPLQNHIWCFTRLVNISNFYKRYIMSFQKCEYEVHSPIAKRLKNLY